MITSIVGGWNFVQDNFQLLSIDGEDKLSSFKTIDPFFTFSCLKNLDGKYYFVGMGRTDVGRDPFVYKYNATTNQIEQEFRVEMGAVDNEDTHRKAVINIDASGNIYLVAETLQPEINLHGTNLEVYKTTTPYDLSSFELLSTITGRFAYPTIHVNGSNIFITARGSDSTVTFLRGEYWMYRSTDGGETFDAGRAIYDSGDEQKVAYFQRLHDYSGNMYYVLNERDNDLENWRYVALIKSTDGITFTNAQESFSKNVDVDGAITRTNMTASCTIGGSPDVNNIACCFEGGVVKSNGHIKVCMSLQSLTGSVIGGNPEVEYDSLRHYTFSSGSWAYNNVDIPAGIECYWAYERPIQYLNNDESFDDIVFIDFTNNHDVYIKRSTDNFATASTNMKKVNGNGLYMMGQAAFNTSTEEDYVIVLADPQGETTSGADETSADYSNLLVCPVKDLPNL